MDNAYPHLHSVIVCGQSGNELWPLVRAGNPREVIVLPGDSESLLESAIRRSREVSSNPVIFVCPAEVADQTHRSIESCRLIGRGDYRLLVEPCRCSSAYSLAFAAAVLKREDPNACILAMRPHVKLDGDDRWEQAVSRGYRAAQDDKIAIFAVLSRRSSSTHSFVRFAGELKEFPGVYQVTAFTPNATQQQSNRYVSLGLHWSTGVVIARATTVLGSMQYVARHCDRPECQEMDRVAETASFMASIDESRWQTQHAEELVRSLPATSLEEAVLPFYPDTAAVPITLDMASMESLHDIDDMELPDEDGNRVVGRGFAIDSLNTTIYDSDRLTVALGCENLLVVNTRDSVLVASKDSLDAIGSVVPQMVEAGAREALSSSVVAYGWGTSCTVFCGEDCRASIHTIFPGKGTGRYSRARTQESWTVLEGQAVCLSAGEYKSYTLGAKIEFGAGVVHEIKNMGDAPLKLMCIESATE